MDSDLDPYNAEDVKRDREITVALVYAAADVACSDVPTERQQKALDFLESWWTRKKPGLGMPKI